MFDSKKIIEETVKDWNTLTTLEKEKQGTRYAHLFKEEIKWGNDFSDLKPFQKKLLVKKTFINYYDSLSNIQKTFIKKDCHLSTFSSKWYKLPNEDKKILLDILFNNL